MCDLSLTAGRVCGAGLDSKLVLKRVSMSVDLPIPVSPVERMDRCGEVKCCGTCVVI